MSKDLSKPDTEEQPLKAGAIQETSHPHPGEATKKPSLLTRVTGQLRGLLKPAKSISIEPLADNLGQPLSALSFLSMATAMGYSGGAMSPPTTPAGPIKTLEDQLLSVAGLLGDDAGTFKNSPAAAMLRARAAHMPTGQEAPAAEASGLSL